MQDKPKRHSNDHVEQDKPKSTPIQWYSLAVQAGLRTWHMATAAVTVACRNTGKQNAKVALLILMQIFLLPMAIAIAEKQMDRYAVREGSPFAMDCKHELENTKVVRWEYVSNHNNTKEIIYDSQSKSLKSGFEVICEPQQTFISTCIIKLIKTKTDDSGKYICYVGEVEGKKAMLDAVIEIELVIRGPKHQTMVVNNGDSVVLPCEHKKKNLTRARWSHVSLQGDMSYQLYYMDWIEPANKNYEGLCKSHQLSCNLKILQANKESAGRYICMVGESLEFEKKYGLDQLTYFIEIQLVVGELQCNENMNKDLTLLGENDCYGIEAEIFNLKCSFNYFGNINYNLLHLSWIEKYKFNSLEKKLNSSIINHEMKDEINNISIQTNLSVAYEMQNSIFQCILENSLIRTCQLHEFKVQYIKNTTKRLPPIHSNDLHNMKCSANKSANVHCSYYWVHEIAGAIVENPCAILPVENMNSPGNYTCIGKCHLGRNECIIKAMEFEILQERTEILIIILYVACGLLAILVVVLIALFLRERFYKPRTDSQLLALSEPSPSTQSVLTMEPTVELDVSNQVRLL